jgi:hypothetical protein
MPVRGNGALQAENGDEQEEDGGKPGYGAPCIWMQLSHR